MKIDNPIYYEDINLDFNEHFHEDGSFSLVWRPISARFFPDTEMIYWVPEYMDTLRSRKSGKEEDKNVYEREVNKTTQQDDPNINFNYDKQCNNSTDNNYHLPVDRVLSKSSKRLIPSPLKKIPHLISPKCTKVLNNSDIQLLPESPESQKVSITFSPESVVSFASTNDLHKTPDFQTPASANKLYEPSPNFYHFDKTPTGSNSKHFFGHKFNLGRPQRSVSDVTDDFIFHRPNAKLNTNSPSYINPIELQRINHRQSEDPLPTPPPLSPWQPYGNSGHIYWNDTKILKGRIPEPKVLDGYLASSLDHNRHRNLDYEPLGMKMMANNSENSSIQQAKDEADKMYRLNLRLFSCIILLILILGAVLILVILRVPFL